MWIDANRGLASQDAIHWILSLVELVLVAIAQLEALVVFAHCAAEVLNRHDPVHGEGRLIGPDYSLAGLNQDHSFGKPGNDLLQLPSINALTGN